MKIKHILLSISLSAASIDYAIASQSFVSDKQYLTQQQYKGSSNYQQRLEVFKYGNQPLILEWAAQIFQQTFSLNDKKILELGAGTGELWEHISKQTDLKKANITLTDISSDMLQDNKRYVSTFFPPTNQDVKIKYVLTDIDHLEKYPSNTYDVIIAQQVIYHAQDPRKALKEMHRMLKPGGFLGLGVVDEDSSKGLWALGHQANERVPTKGFTSVFCEKHIENEGLLASFSSCDTHLYRNKLSFKEEAKEVPLNSFKSSPTIAGLHLDNATFDKMRKIMSDEIKDKGAFEYEYRARIYTCKK